MYSFRSEEPVVNYTTDTVKALERIPKLLQAINGTLRLLCFIMALDALSDVLTAYNL